LVQLQNVDNRLQDLEELKGDLPHQIDVLKARLRSLEESCNSKQAELEDSRKRRALLEGEVDDLREKLKKYQNQLYQVSTNREYDAITVEIDTIKAKISDTETEILQLIELEENLATEGKSLSEELESARSTLSETQVRLEKKISETEVETSDYSRQREMLVKDVTQSVLYQYERIRKGLGNTAVAMIVNRSACGGCFSTIPPQKVVEVRAMSKLILCESCGRILVYPEEEAVTS
jgi:hypothetical protein